MGVRQLGSAVTALAAFAWLVTALAARPALADPVSTCNGVGIVTDSNGNAVLSPDGQINCVYTYDASVSLLGQAEAATPIGTPATTTYTYDSVYNRVDSITDPGSQTTTYQYNPTYPSELQSTTAPGSMTTQYDYNGSQLTQTTDPLGNITKYQYDTQNRLSQVQEPSSQTYTYTYYDTGPDSGLLENVTDPAGHITTYTYDSDRRLIEADTSSLSQVTTYTYYDSGPDEGLLEQVDASGVTTNYYYDAAGLLCSETDPTCTTTSYTYDADGQLISDSDTAGLNLIYTSDIPEPASLLLLGSGLLALAARRRRIPR